MDSAIYEGSVYHQRYSPKRHKFKYNMSMLYLDLAKLPELLDEFWFYSARGWAPGSFRRSDHIGDNKQPLLDSVSQRFQEKFNDSPDQVFLLTNLRYYGFCFNPVSFYFGYDTNDRFNYLGAEVHNTPWHEEFFYPLSVTQDSNSNSSHRNTTFDKEFHVSPFLPMDLQYDLSVSPPGSEIFTGIRVHDGTSTNLYAEMNLTRKELNQKNLNAILTTFPVETVKIVAGIYFQALQLWLKGLPYYEHPNKKDARANVS